MIHYLVDWGLKTKVKKPMIAPSIEIKGLKSERSLILKSIPSLLSLELFYVKSKINLLNKLTLHFFFFSRGSFLNITDKKKTPPLKRVIVVSMSIRRGSSLPISID